MDKLVLQLLFLQLIRPLQRVDFYTGGRFTIPESPVDMAAIFYLCGRHQVGPQHQMKTEDIDYARGVLSREWGLSSEAQGLEGLQQDLLLHLQWLLDHDLERLVNAMYRMDVREDLFRKAMALPGTGRAQALCRLVWERELQRIAFRRQYKASSDEHESA